MTVILAVGQPLPKHPQYDAQHQARSFWRRSDLGKWDYAQGTDAHAKQVLPKHEREPEDRYQRRRGQAMVRRYARPILDRYCDFVTRTPAHRPDAGDGTPYGVILKDADGAGTPLPRLMKFGIRKGQVDGTSFLLADANDPGVYPSAAAESAAGKRGIIRLVDADQVYHYRYFQGVLVEALIIFDDRDGAKYAWYVNEKITQRVEFKEGNGVDPGAGQTVSPTYLITAIGPPQPHGYKYCPLVPLVPVPEGDGAEGEDSQCAPIAEQQKRICNLDSWLWEELQGGTFTTPVFLGVSPESFKDVKIGPGNAIAIPGEGGGNPAIGKLGADPAQAQSLRDQFALEVRETYRVAGLASGNPTEAAQPESGVAKAFAFNEIEAKCAAIADAAEHAENAVILRLSNAFGFAYPGDADWPEEFSSPDLADELQLTLDVQNLDLPQIIQRKQVERLAAEYALSGPDKATLDQQLNDADKRAQDRMDNPLISGAVPPKPGAPVGPNAPVQPAVRMPGT